MRRLFAWLAGAAGGAAAVEALRRRQARPAPAPPVEPAGPDPRAEELRAKLAETPAVETRAEVPEPEPEPELPAEDPQERRRRVHESGRSALDEIRRTDDGTG
jgi:outer membrane biosynthesis protein TonB